MNRAEAERRGRRAETIAAWWLRLQGWRIIGTRVRTPVGEIDLIARRGRTVAFIEVKARHDEEGLALAIDRRRLMRVARATEALLPRYVPAGADVRIDVILIAPRRLPHHLKNVWHG
ncbi:MAG: YraN family protein [Sphingomonadaceae bacterium]